MRRQCIQTRKSQPLPSNFSTRFFQAATKNSAVIPIANAYAMEGLTAFVGKFPGGAPQAALEKCVKQNLDCYRQHHRADWKWFDATMTYDTGRFSLAMLLAFEATGNAECRQVGLESLDFLLKVCFSPDGRQLRPVGNKGWYPRDETPAQFDQQPIDAASIVEACVVAARITGEKKYAVKARKAFDWFLGNNLKGSGGLRPGFRRMPGRPYGFGGKCERRRRIHHHVCYRPLQNGGLIE